MVPTCRALRNHRVSTEPRRIADCRRGPIARVGLIGWIGWAAWVILCSIALLRI
jgi:hypothetical protein